MEPRALLLEDSVEKMFSFLKPQGVPFPSSIIHGEGGSVPERSTVTDPGTSVSCVIGPLR